MALTRHHRQQHESVLSLLRLSRSLAPAVPQTTCESEGVVMPEMFLRTAQTEKRIDDLEKSVAEIRKHLGMDDDTPNVPVPELLSSTRNGVGQQPVGQPSAELPNVRRDGDEPAVPAASNRRKRS